MLVMDRPRTACKCKPLVNVVLELSKIEYEGELVLNSVVEFNGSVFTVTFIGRNIITLSRVHY